MNVRPLLWCRTSPFSSMIRSSDCTVLNASSTPGHIRWWTSRTLPEPSSQSAFSTSSSRLLGTTSDNVHHPFHQGKRPETRTLNLLSQVKITARDFLRQVADLIF